MYLAVIVHIELTQQITIHLLRNVTAQLVTNLLHAQLTTTILIHIITTESM